MKQGARAAAAIDIVDTILTRYQPVPVALADWGKANRYAGSGDRNVIGHMVYDALRHRSSSAWMLGSESARALVLGAMRQEGTAASEIAGMCTGNEFTPAPLSDDERTRLEAASLQGAPDAVAGNYPEWLEPAFRRTFGDRAIAEGQALSRRAPADLRVNTMRSTRDKVLAELAQFGAIPTPMSPLGVRIPIPTGYGRIPNLMVEPLFQDGGFEIQDEGSQIAAALTGARAGMQVLDLCAGGGGKTLAMAAAMQKKGQIFAYDSDRARLSPMFDRLKRAGARNVQMLRGGDVSALDALGANMDLVVADSPCTGTGTWRRRPDAKWRLKPAALEARVEDQKRVLERASRHVKPGGRLVYITCSILPEENTDQITGFLVSNAEFVVEPYGDLWRASIGTPPPRSADGREDTLLLTPASHGTDGFFIASLRRRV